MPYLAYAHLSVIWVRFMAIVACTGAVPIQPVSGVTIIADSHISFLIVMPIFAMRPTGRGFAPRGAEVALITQSVGVSGVVATSAVKAAVTMELRVVLVEPWLPQNVVQRFAVVAIVARDIRLIAVLAI